MKHNYLWLNNHTNDTDSSYSAHTLGHTHLYFSFLPSPILSHMLLSVRASISATIASQIQYQTFFLVSPLILSYPITYLCKTQTIEMFVKTTKDTIFYPWKILHTVNYLSIFHSST